MNGSGHEQVSTGSTSTTTAVRRCRNEGTASYGRARRLPDRISRSVSQGVPRGLGSGEVRQEKAFLLFSSRFRTEGSNVVHEIPDVRRRYAAIPGFHVVLWWNTRLNRRKNLAFFRSVIPLGVGQV